MPAVDVTFALTGNIRYNSRAIKQLHLLADLGLNVHVLTLGARGPSPFSANTIRVQYLPGPTGRGPRLFAHIHTLFTRASRSLYSRVYHASDLYTLPAMRAAAGRSGGHLVYDARELYTHVASTAGRPWVRGVWRLVEGRHIRKADAVFTVSSHIARHLAQMYGITPPVVLHNVPPLQTVVASGTLRRAVGIDSDAIVLLHQGKIQKARGCFLLVHAMQDVRGGQLVFLGDGPRKADLQEYVSTLGVQDRVHFLEPVPPDTLLSVTACANIGITLLEDMCLNHRFALPNKLFEYLMAGIPVLASNLPEMRSVVETFQVGCTVDPSDRSALAYTLQKAINQQHTREQWISNIPGVFKTFSWETASYRFCQTYKNLLCL